jgi:hypothetical protein
MDAKYLHLTIQKLTLGLLIAGALICLSMALFNINPLNAGPFMRIVLLIIGIAGILHIFSRDFYLPFLGETVMPCAALEERTPSGADTTVTVQVPPNSKLLYWAAEPAAEELKQIQDWKLAYAAFSNIGVTTSDQSGTATLRVRNPQAYSVPFKGRLEPHIHYRICGEDGIMSRVNTVFINAIEGFTAASAAATNPNQAIMQLLNNPNAIQDIAKMIPQMTQMMEGLSNVVTGTTAAPSSQPGQSLKEAFRTS